MHTWSWAWAFRNFFAELLMPPGLFIVLALCAFLFLKKRQTLQKVIVVLSLVMIWVASTPIFTHWLVKATGSFMVWPAPLDIPSIQMSQVSQSQQPQAIVVLGGGRRRGALESSMYGYQDLSKDSLERVRYAAKLAQQTHLPILTTGGMPDQVSQQDQAEAKVMAQVLKEEFHQETQWVEDQSATTQENAAFSARLLKQQGITRIFLVTHFWHMPRAQKIFEKEGLQVVAAPHGFENSDALTPLDFYPGNIYKTRQIWHEVMGMFWYSIRY